MYKMKTILLLILILGLGSVSSNNTGTISNIFFSLKYFHSNPGPCQLSPPSQRGDVHWVLLQHTVTHHEGVGQKETTEESLLNQIKGRIRLETSLGDMHINSDAVAGA